MSIIKLKNVSKFYYNKNSISSGFNKLNLDLDMGEFVVITGESGSGKSTLLNVISGLDSYEEGEMYIDGEETSHYTEVDYENYRRKYIGNIFQNFNLVNSYTVYQNVELVLLLNGYKKEEIKEKVLEIIKTVNLTKYKNTKASKLSGGQKQRVAIARALAKDTPIIVADEPTGNLDVKSAKSVMKLLKDISKNKLVVIVTHNYEQVEEYATRRISMNDGKIIEDKKISAYEPAKAELVQYRDLTKKNKLILGLRNAFNIKTKFGLLFLVYFFLTMLVFSEYSSLNKASFDAELEGDNYYFSEKSPNRVILKKNDKTSFTEKDIDDLKNMENIKSVVKEDMLLDLSISSMSDGSHYIYIAGNVKEIDKSERLDKGTLPERENEIVFVGSKDSYYLSFFEDEILNSEFDFQDDKTGSILGKFKITGIKYDDSLNDNTSYFLISKSGLERLKQSETLIYNKQDMKLNGHIFSTEDDETNRFNIKKNKSVPKGKVYAYSELNAYCENYTCLDEKMILSIENIYYKKDLEVTIKEILNNDNFEPLLGLKPENYPYTIFLNDEDYDALISKEEYQVSVFIDDLKQSDKTLKELKEKGYYTYFMKDNLVDEAAEVKGLILMFRAVIFMIATGSLFFISYFIIKIILKSRNIYFSTIRILGATKNVAKQLLDIELLIDINIAYISFLGITLLARSGIITNSYLKDMVEFFTFKDFVLIYVVLIIMSLLISNRYAHKLFKSSVMKTYREEV